MLLRGLKIKPHCCIEFERTATAVFEENNQIVYNDLEMESRISLNIKKSSEIVAISAKFLLDVGYQQKPGFLVLLFDQIDNSNVLSLRVNFGEMEVS